MKTFEHLVKKTKRRKLVVTALWSSLLSLFLLVFLAKGLAEIASHFGRETRDQYQTMAEISFPNVQYRSAYFDARSLVSGDFISDRTKDISGIQVPYERYVGHYNLFGRRDGLELGTYSDQTGGFYTRLSNLKVPLFYNINHDYTSLSKDAFGGKTQDLPLVKEMAGQAVELAVTFDKAYTMGEIAELIPDNLKVSWYWIGTETDFNTRLLGPSHQLGFSLSQMDMSAEQVAQVEKARTSEGFSEAYDRITAENGQWTPEKNMDYNFSFFRKFAQKALDEGWLSGSSIGYNDQTWKPDKDMQAFLDQYQTGREAKYAGVILTGRAENFAQLEEVDWIFASSIGQSVFIQPYHQLDGE